ncbi:MAG TPA: T9SS type A sorting domain-containing protein [Bacteroidales bacterium]|nr:T9SS type A sorting domain-containing protein [Bacteroidales bacterium]
MKTLVLFIAILVAMVSVAFSQIPNYGFEIWTNYASYNNPDDWATMNPFCTGPDFYSVTKSTDHYPENVGNYSLRLESNTSLTQETGGWGVVATKSFDYPFKPSFPVIGHPTSLCGYAKFLPQNGDEASVSVVLFLDGEQIGHNSMNISSTDETWQPFTVDFDSYVEADSATIIFMAWTPEGPVDPPAGNSVIFIDNLNFDSHLTEINNNNSNLAPLTLFPNPANDELFLNFHDGVSDISKLVFLNSNGCIVKSVDVNSSLKHISVSDLSTGLYFIEFYSDRKIKSQKLIIMR